MSVSVEIRPALVSKATTVLQVGTIFLALFIRCLPNGVDHKWLGIFFWGTAIFTVVSGLNYMSRGFKLINHDVKK
jgi:cardiolipin synthase